MYILSIHVLEGDEENKKKAERLFAKLKLAHEGINHGSNSFDKKGMIHTDTSISLSVLIDPHKRAIYDCLGKRGLEEQGWEIVQRTKTPKEIREEYEQLAK